MNAKKILALTGMLYLVAPQTLRAQWNLSRFDQYNYFTFMETVSGDHAFSAGIESSGNGSFLLRTNDGGLTWDSLTVSPSCLFMDMMFTDPDNGYAGGVYSNQQVLLRTSDNGSTWTDVTPNAATSLGISGISFLDPLNGFVSDESQVYRTLDAGTNWTAFSPGMTVVDIGFSSMDIGYACGSQSPFAAVMKTTDGGVTWSTALTTTLPFFTISSMQKVEVVNQDVVYVSGQYSNKLFKTVNGGQSWDTITVSVVTDITDFDFSTADEGHIVSYMGEIYATSDGGQNWTLEYTVAAGAYGPSVLLTSMSFKGNEGFICGTNGLIKKHGVVPTGSFHPEVMDLPLVYPNPVRAGEILNIQTPIRDFKAELFDVAGRNVGNFTGQDAVPVPHVTSGVYSLTINSGGTLSRHLITITE